MASKPATAQYALHLENTVATIIGTTLIPGSSGVKVKAWASPQCPRPHLYNDRGLAYRLSKAGAPFG